jgi:hypothetical protein
MNINYLGYSKNLISESITDSPAKVYVFDNYKNKEVAKENYCKPFLKKESIFLTLSELKEKLFPVERLMLKEEKRTVILYELLNETDKKELNINNYFDIIDLAADFFNFFAELHEYNIKKIDGLKDWQKKKFTIFQNLRRRYRDYMDKSGYTDSTLNYKFSNFNLQYLKDYNRIVFVNIINFTPREKEILNQLEEGGKNIKLHLQLSPDDFDEEKLRLKSVSLPDKLHNEVEIYHTSEDLLQLVNLLSQFDISNANIMDAAFSNSNYHKILNSKQIKVDKDLFFTQTEIFRFLNNFYQFLNNADKKGQNIKIKMEDLMGACYQEGFRKYYNISATDFNKLFQLANEDYVYFSRDLITTKLEDFAKILDDLEKISRFKTLHDFIDFMEDLDLKLLNDREFSNNHVQFFDALAELESLEDMNLVSSWNNYFENRAGGLFRLIINYLRFKKVKKIEEENEQNNKIEDLHNAEHIKRENLLIMNANSGVIPTPPGNDFLFTEKQREDLGLPVSKDQRIKEKYMFYRHIFNSDRAVIYSLENIDNNLTTSSFVEELKLNMGLESKEPEIQADNYTEVVNSIFSLHDNFFNDYLLAKNSESDFLGIKSADFPQKGFSISYYKYKHLKDCYYRFYLEHIVGLTEEKIEFEDKLNRKVLGIIVHEMFEDIINDLKQEIKGGYFKPEEGFIGEIVLKKVDSYNLKIPKYFLPYYENIIIPRIQKSINVFFDSIKKRTNSDIDMVLSEWTPGKNENFLEAEKASFYLNGRIDLILDTDTETHIIDFKTGGGKMKQLDFYSLLIEPGLDDDQLIRKYIYSVMDEDLKEGYNNPQKLKEKLSDEIGEFIDSNEYTAIYKTRCKRCEYQDICRVVIK